ncbi:hypothetical protein JTE90_026105 [Oedothorax gibbosus]|uniref:Uncharacterized protein n=1 Tax=Oedothorax gibbosus TaxID=931172 RepID=A0AAV6TTZ9_9ARAC|nr:hypothetical protein JTE90_026105 [Oedothorax gibbosus]
MENRRPTADLNIDTDAAKSSGLQLRQTKSPYLKKGGTSSPLSSCRHGISEALCRNQFARLIPPHSARKLRCLSGTKRLDPTI